MAPSKLGVAPCQRISTLTSAGSRPAWVGELVNKRVAERRPDHHLQVGVRRGSSEMLRLPLARTLSSVKLIAMLFVSSVRGRMRLSKSSRRQAPGLLLRASSSIIDLDSPDRKVNENPSTIASSTGAGDAVHVENPSSLDPNAASDAVHPETPRPTMPNPDFPKLGEFMDSMVDEGMDCDDEDPLWHGYGLLSHD